MAGSPRNQAIIAVLKKLFGDVPATEQRRIAREAGISTPSKPKLGEQLDLPLSKSATTDIEKWPDEGVPRSYITGVGKYLGALGRLEKKATQSPLARLGATKERAAIRKAEREKRLELKFDRPRTGEEVSKLFEIEQRTGELTKQLDTLKTTGQATKNLEDFTEALTNQKIIEAAIKAGYSKPGIWNKAQGLPPWPKELRSAEAIAKIRLGIDPSKAPSLPQQAKLRTEIRAMSGTNGRTPEEVMSKINQEQIEKNVQDLIAGREITGRRVHERTLPIEEQKRIAQLERERTESGLDFSAEERIKGESGKPQLTPQEEIEASWRRVASDPRTEPPTGVHPRTGEMLPEELPWSDYHQRKYDTLLREKRVNDPNYMPTGVEERALQKEVADEIDKEAIFSDKILTVDMPRSSDVRYESALGEKSVIPVSGTEGKYIRGDVGSPASTMHEQMRSTGYTEEAVDDLGLLPEQDIAFTTDNIDTEAIMQRYQDPQAVLEKLKQDPDIAIPPSVRAEKAFGSARSPRRDPRDLPIDTVPPSENISYGVPRGRVPSRRQLDLSIIEEPSPEVAADLRSRAADIRRRGGKFYGETARLNPQQREQAWEEIRSRPEFIKYMQDNVALKREIGITAPDIMEFDPYTRAQKTTRRPRISPKIKIIEPIQLDLVDDLLKQETELDLALKEGKININDPEIMARWKADAPRREAKIQLLEKADQDFAKLRQNKRLVAAEKELIKRTNQLADQMDAVDTGFIKKDGTPSVTAWKKAGRPEPLDWKDRYRDPGAVDFIVDPSSRVTRAGPPVRPKRKLVDSFKKGRKIVNRKRGSMIKKPRGWGAARYNGR